MAAFNQRLRGHWEYYWVIGNFASLRQFYDAALRILRKWLNRRSQKASYTWQAFTRCLTRLGVERPRIGIPAPATAPVRPMLNADTRIHEEPGAGIPHAGIRAGGAG